MNDSTHEERDRPEFSELIDMDGNFIEVMSHQRVTRLCVWIPKADRDGQPYRELETTLGFTPQQAIDLARRLFLAATD